MVRFVTSISTDLRLPMADSPCIKRSLELENTETLKKVKTEVAVAAKKNVFIQALSLKGDFVTIMNCGLEDVDLSGWKIESLVGDNQEYYFPAKTVLHPGCTTTVWSGKDADKKHNPPYALFWTKKNMWNDSGDTAVLRDADGNEIDTVEEKPFVYSHEIEIQKLDLLKDYVTVINKSKSEHDISGWFLKSLIGSQSFVFPEGTKLASGSTITVWSGKEAEKKECPPSSMFWTKRFMWNDNGDAAALYNATGHLVSYQQYFPVKVKEFVTPPVKKE